MFTGIIEALGHIQQISSHQTNKTFWVKSELSGQLKVDESLSHNGVCLTIEKINNDIYQVTAIKETLDKTNLQTWKVNDVINLERSMQLNGRLDGHIVQGHIDGVASCIEKKDLGGSAEFTFNFPDEFASLIIEKGSVSVNGVSLTAFNVGRNIFTVAIIPYTLQHTNFKNTGIGDIVNIEFDVLGKYVNRQLAIR